jgi:hypothetical protein
VDLTEDFESFCQEEVYGLPSNDSTSGEDEKMSDSDIEGQDDNSNDLPDVRAWGQRRKNFYNTDYIDHDHGGKKLFSIPISENTSGRNHDIKSD